jgi:hypothetical protein
MYVSTLAQTAINNLLLFVPPSRILSAINYAFDPSRMHSVNIDPSPVL